MFICVSFWQSFFISTTYFLFEQDYLKRYNQIGMGIWISRCIITPWSLLYSFFFQLFSSSIFKVFVLLFGWLSSLLSNVWSVLTCKRILRRVASTDFLGIQNLFAYSCYDVTFATTWHLRPPGICDHFCAAEGVAVKLRFYCIYVITKSHVLCCCQMVTSIFCSTTPVI